MRWFGKAIGAALGMALGSYPGAVLGALLGHQFDLGLADRLAVSSPRAQRVFFAVTFEVMGRIAKIDGRVSEEEIRTARQIMHAMSLGPEQVQQAIGHFNTGKSPDYPLRQRINDLAAQIAGRAALARTFVEIQVQAAVGSGELAESKRELLWQIARSLGLSRVDLAQIESSFRNRSQGRQPPAAQVELAAAYKILDVLPESSDKDVKTAYRRLMSRHHPDKLVANGLPESMTAVAEQKTRQIRAAYDRIKADRGLK